MLRISMRVSKTAALLAFTLSFFGYGASTALAQEDTRVSYVPLIGISSVPQPLALPDGPGDVTYHYAVKNFLKEYPLTDVLVDDDKCSPVMFIEGDDNGDGKLDYDETWRYTCTVNLVQTTQSIATAIGASGGLPAAHKAYATVVVGSDLAAPLVNIINVTKVAHPLTLPIGGGDITFTYRVNNPGVVPLSDVSVTDDKCSDMSSKLGDTNGNGLLDITEVWVYTCTTHLEQTTTNTVSVVASANGLRAVGYATITITVDTPTIQGLPDLPIPTLPETGRNPELTVGVWGILSGVLAGLLLLYASTYSGESKKKKKGFRLILRIALFSILVGGAVAGIAQYFLMSRTEGSATDTSSKLALSTDTDDVFGWKFPVAKFPPTGSTEIAYSDIRDPGGIPEGLPVRLKIPIIGVDSAIEDAYITPDGRMDVPAGSRNVAWFALGPNPGEEGSAVIGGHFGITRGVPFVFYDLDKLKVGDFIYVVDDRDVTQAFVVRDIKLFDRDADATTVFTSDDGIAHLNLITCEGIWNKVNDTYPDRRVVFTDAVPEGGVVEPVTTFQRSLSIGARGADVIELQTAMVARGFLVMPAGVAMGYYGPLTRSAVIRYQTSVGLPPLGVFNQETSSRLLAMAAVGSGLPAAGTDTVTTFNRSLSVGARGTDVIELQTAMVARGFLEMPAGVAMGYYGPLTRDAVIRYQTSVGLPPLGVFNQETNSRLLAIAAIGSGLPAAGSNTDASVLDTTSQTVTQADESILSRAWHGFIQAMQSLFTPPIVGAVTSLLLFAITFVIVKLFRRTP